MHSENRGIWFIPIANIAMKIIRICLELIYELHDPPRCNRVSNKKFLHFTIGRFT